MKLAAVTQYLSLIQIKYLAVVTLIKVNSALATQTEIELSSLLRSETLYWT